MTKPDTPHDWIETSDGPEPSIKIINIEELPEPAAIGSSNESESQYITMFKD